MKELNVFERWVQGDVAIKCNTEVEKKTFLLLVADYPLFDLKEELRFWNLKTPYATMSDEGHIRTYRKRFVTSEGYETMTFDEFIAKYWKERFEDEESEE